MTDLAKNTSPAAPEGEEKIPLRIGFIRNRNDVSAQIARVVAGVLDPNGQLPLEADAEKLEIPRSKIGAVRHAISDILSLHDLKIDDERSDAIVIADDEEKPSVWAQTIGPGNVRPGSGTRSRRAGHPRHPRPKNRSGRRNGSVPF